MFLEDNIMKYYEGFSKKYLRSGATITEVFLYKKQKENIEFSNGRCSKSKPRIFLMN